MDIQRRLKRLENTRSSSGRCKCKDLAILMVDEDENGKFFDSLSLMGGAPREIPREVVDGHRPCGLPACVNRRRVVLMVYRRRQPSEGDERRQLVHME
jgi:hypothetical protein